MSKKVVVLGEAREGALRNVSFEAIAAAKKIAGWRGSRRCIVWRCCSVTWAKN